MAIDEKKLKKDLLRWFSGKKQYCINNGLDDLLNDFEDCFDAFEDIIKAQPKLSLETKTSDKWIPVTERLPDEHENYIVTVCDECNMIWAETVVVLAEYFEGSWLWYEGGDEYDITDMVIAWMTLPEPYKVE